MSEEEKIIFEYFKTKHFNYIPVLSNMIENQQKEMENLKEIEKSHKEENGKLRVELEQEKEKNKEYEKQLDLDYVEKNYISKDKIKEIVDEHIPKQPNIITGEMEYTPNTNANSFLVQDILKLLEEK
jgi:regulator of replication initiation timing